MSDASTLWKVNAAEQPDLLRYLCVYSIPTLIAYHNGEEAGHDNGSASAKVLSYLFESTLTGKKKGERGDGAR
jgi:hypothetical protein